MIRVLVVAGICLYREGLAEILARRGGIDVVATASGLAEAAGVLRGLEPPPDVVLVDMTTDDAAAVRALVAERPGLAVVALTVPDDEGAVLACAEAGVAAFVTREASLDDLVAMVESVKRGEALVSPSLTAALLRRVAALARARDEARPPSATPLTSRELEIVALIDQGLSNKQIAQRLSIELPTVKNHVHHILDKLGVHRRGEAAARVRAAARTD